MMLSEAPPPDNIAAWTAYLTALRDQLRASWTSAVAAYNALKSVRQTLGLDFIVAAAPENAPAGMGSSSAWSADLDQQAVDIMAMVTLITGALDDAIAGKRKVNWNPATTQFEIERLPADLLRLELKGDAPVLIDNASGNQQHVQGQVGAPALVWAATLVGSIAALPAYWVVKRVVDGMTDVAEQKTMNTIAEKSYECVKAGNCTPEQAAALNKSIYSGAAGVRAQKVEQIKAENQPTTDITKTVTTVAYVALGLAVLYAIVKLVPPAGARTPPARQLPARRQELLMRAA